MTNVVDINSRRIKKVPGLSIVPDSFCQNKNLNPMSIAVGVYINSKNSSGASADELKENFNLGAKVLEFVFEELKKEGYLRVCNEEGGTRSLTLDLNGF